MTIKRARGHRLYTVDGKKILDLSMDGGRAVIGHRPNGLSLTIKNLVDRGVYAKYDNIYLRRLSKYLKGKFEDYPYITILEYEDKVSTHFNEPICDPLTADCTGSKLSYWRPFLESPQSDNLVILYPLPGLNSVTVLLSKEELSLKSDSVSPLLLAGILRSMYDYDADLKIFSIEDYKAFKSVRDSIFKPPYLILNRSEDELKALSVSGLEVGIMLNDNGVQILGKDFSKGEQSKILELLK